MSAKITAVSAIEIPVSNVKQATKWYMDVFDLNSIHRGETDAMLVFRQKGTPGLYLVETNDQKRLSFVNSYTKTKHSVIDFFTNDLIDFKQYLENKGIETSELQLHNGIGGFGIQDIDGNRIGICNILQTDHDYR